MKNADRDTEQWLDPLSRQRGHVCYEITIRYASSDKNRVCLLSTVPVVGKLDFYLNDKSLLR